MYKINRKILRLIPLLFFIVIVVKIVYSYNETKALQQNFAQKEAEVLASYMKENRDYYRTLFLNGTLELNEKTLPALPAFSATPISKLFSEKNPLNIGIRTTSDRPRNPQNKADINELKAIEYFKNNPQQSRYFSEDDKDIYQYAVVLKIEQECLKCHSKREEAPLYIRQKYNESYDYSLGDVRGIISIQMPKANLTRYFYTNLTKSIFFDLLLLIILFAGVAYVLKQSKNINEKLEEKINEKTKELKNAFLIDSLTNLPNRLQLMDDLKNTRHLDSRHLALINIDSFKNINDLYGYAFGDKVLIEASNRIEKFCQNKNHIYKLPNDEFAIFTTQVITQDDFIKSIKSLLVNLQEHTFDIDNESIFISFSSGIASNQDQLLVKASGALQLAKIDSNTIVIYDDSLDTKEQISKKLEILAILKDAIANDRVTPYYQPIYNIKTGTITKYEALIRVISLDGRVLTPYAFLDIAIKSKIYPELTRIMLDKTFEYFKDKEFDFSLNLSILDIKNPETMKLIEDKLKNYDASRVTFEILESDKIESYSELKNFINIIKQYKSKMAIDDFGSGYSNFAHILELKVDFLKIDASLVKNILYDINSKVIVKTIIDFATNIGLQTIAEFVEDRDSLELLKDMGVDYIQGYYIGKPEASIDYSTK